MNALKVIQTSSPPAFPNGARGVLLPFHRLCFQYPIPHIQLPGNGYPTISCPDLGTLAGGYGKGRLLTSLPEPLFPMIVDILHAPGYKLCPDRHLKFVLIPGPTNRDTPFSSSPLEHGNDIWPSKLYGVLNYFLYGSPIV